ncbi:hypothetical protein O988_07807 [Pseudogymnoascus sp. VKM F-3808]|nr:hypothetical protein O988_07807 [Pseudogymnoascus sp. VKM F-3808]
MRFKTSLRNIKTFSKLTASLATLGKIAWVRLDDENVRFTIIPEQGSQVWACISIDSLFYEYSVQSRIENNTINIELPLAPLQTALRSAENATSASLRLTKRDGDAILSLTIVTNTPNPGASSGFLRNRRANDDPFADDDFHEEPLDARSAAERETIVTQEIPIRVLSPEGVEGIHEPKVRDSDVHILLPPLLQLKAISDRFTKLAFATTTNTAAAVNSTANTPKLELSANMHGSLKLSITTDALNIESVWGDLTNPDLEPNQIEGEVDDLPTEKMRAAGPEAWATVRIDGKDWSRVLSVGRLGGKVIACFVDNHALILYVYLANYEDPGAKESVLTFICPLMYWGFLLTLRMSPKRTIDDVDPEDRDAIKRIHKQTFHDGATIDQCLEAYHKHQGIDQAIESLKDHHELREVSRFRQRIEMAASKSLHAAAGLPEPSPDDEQVKPLWCFAEDMDLEEEEEVMEEISPDVEDMITGGKMDLKKGKSLITPPPERQDVIKSFLSVPPQWAIARDVFGRPIHGLQLSKQQLDAEKAAAAFKARAILGSALNYHPHAIRNRRAGQGFRFLEYGQSNPLKFREVDRETVNRFGHAPHKFTEAFPAITFDKPLRGPTVKINRQVADGTTKLRCMNVSASPLWSGKAGLHTTPDRQGRSVQLNTLSPEEIHLGDYYHRQYNPVAPYQFTRFPELPPHVQDLIWEFSFAPRIVEIHYNPQFTRIWTPTKWPAQGVACKQSNIIMRRVYEKFPFGDDVTGRDGLLFNFDIDVFFLTFEKKSELNNNGQVPLRARRQLNVAGAFLQSLPPATLPKIRNLGLDLSLWMMIEDSMAGFRRRRHSVAGKTKLLLPLLTGLKSLRIIHNVNAGTWRMNKERPFEMVSREDLVAREITTDDLGMNGRILRVDIGELLKDRSAQSENASPPWWSGNGVLCVKMVLPWAADEPL